MNEKFGQFVRNKREEKKINLRKLAEILDIAPAYMSDMEKARRYPPDKEKLAKNANFHFAPAHCALQRAAAVAAYGKVMAEEGKAISGNELELIYLRKSQAEREREERLEKEAAEHV